MKKITLLIFMMFSLTLTFAQVGISENFDSGTPAGWTDDYSNSPNGACAGNSERGNIWSSNTTGNLTTPNQVGLSNGTDLTLSFDYKIVDYNFSNPTVATGTGWGTADIQYSTDDGATWNTVFTIDDSNHTTANTCAPFSVVIPAASLPNGSDVKLQIANTWGTGDYYFYVDNFSATQVVANPPNCDATLTQTTDVSTLGNISWSAATGIPEGYFLTVGSTSGGTDLVNNVDVGNVTSYSLGTLMGGTTYYVTITPYNSNGSATGCVEQTFTTFVPAPNDECENAIGLTVNSDLACGSVTAGSNVNSTASAQADDVTGTPNTDVWYSFVATAESHQVVLSNVVYVSGGTFSSTDMGMGVYDATSGCGALTFVDDSDPNTLFLSGLTIGNTYLVRVYNWSSTIFYNTFDICVGTPPSAPENDECSAAVPLTVNEDLNCTEVTNGTIAAATDSGVNTCGGTEDDDVWFSFVATSETHTVSLLNITGGTTDLYHAVYDADPGCEALGTALTCSDPNNSTTSGLTVGNTYFVQVYSWTSTAGQTSVFDICIGTPPPPPANDDCATAETLTVNTDGTCTITTSGTLESSTESSIDPSCDTGTEWDVWYSFVAPSSGNIDFTVTLGTGNPLEYAVFDDCAGTTQLYCSDPLDGTSLTGLTPGTTYYLMVWNDGFETPGDFTICASEPTCTPSTATYTVVSDCDNSGGFLIDVEITDMGSATNLTVSNDQDATTFPATSTGTIVQFGPYTNGTDVIITVSDDSDANCSYDSSAITQVACPPSNDNCAGATMLTQETEIADAASATPNPGTLEAATDSGLPAETCNGWTGTANDDVWYSFEALTTDVTITIDNTTVDIVIQAYSGTCGAFTNIGCADSGNPEEIALTGLNVGETYYFRVYQYGTGSTVGDNFDAKVWSTQALSTEDFDKEAAFTYYPNPVNNNLNLSSQKEINNVSVYNMVGQEVYRSTPNTMTDVVDMSGLQAGAYFVKVTVGNATKTVKVIKK